mgnify:CR=1 FL=1
MVEMTEEILIRFINNTCSDEELTAVKMWLDESEDNAAKLFEMERIAMLAGELRDNATTRKRMFDYVQQRIIADEFAKRKKKRIMDVFCRCYFSYCNYISIHFQES